MRLCCLECGVSKDEDWFGKSRSGREKTCRDCRKKRRGEIASGSPRKRRNDFMDEKTCIDCGTLKPRSEFYNNGVASRPNAVRPECKRCSNIRSLAANRENPAQRRATAYKSHLKHKYGISIEEVDAMREYQGGDCALCACFKTNGGKPKLHVDHDHAMGRVRRLLCRNCNVGLGLFQDSPTLLRKAAMYVEEFKEFKCA